MSIIISLDVMGGDHAPHIVLKGAEHVLSSCQNISGGISFILCGDEDIIRKSLPQYPLLLQSSSILHAQTVVTNTLKPSVALRQAAHSGMGLAIKEVAEGRASAVVSAGNTGAYMALSKMFLKTLPGVDRPAIAKIMPTASGRSVVLDLGANAECKVDHLVQFGIMGSVLAEYAGVYTPKDTKNDKGPSVGVLNIGSEASKGLPHLQETVDILSNHVNCYGFVEGNDITKGTTDVVVTDGFSGNVALKAIEGTAHLMKVFLKDALSPSLRGKLGYLIAKPAFKSLAVRMDPRLYNGAILLGLRGIAVKSHGGTDDIGYAEAIKVAVELASSAPQNNLFEKNFVAGIKELSFNRTIQERLSRLSKAV